MKSIPAIDLPGARKLSPMEMNKIIFETGKHSESKAAASTSDPVQKPRS